MDKLRLAPFELMSASNANPIAAVLSNVDLLSHVAAAMDASEDVLRALTVNSSFAAAFTTDIVWEARCKELWRDKLHVPERFSSRAMGLSRIAAYFGSISDSTRTRITAEELCAFRWHGRMKECAGEAWTARDPWWQGKPARARVYRQLRPGAGTFESVTPDGYELSGTWRMPWLGGAGSMTADRVRHSRDGIEVLSPSTSARPPCPETNPPLSIHLLRSLLY